MIVSRYIALPATLVTLILATPRPGAAEMRAFDKNGDGKNDKWAYFDGEWPTEIRYDKNFDGNVDEWEFLVNGRMSELREDRNYDSKVDRIVNYENGYPTYRKVDEDFDGRFDALVFYDKSDNVRTASPELVRLLAEKAGEAPPAPKAPAAQGTSTQASPRRKILARKEAAAAMPQTSHEALYGDYFDLGEPALRIPRLGAGLKPEKEWHIEHNRGMFFGLFAGHDYELQHRPTRGILWVERDLRDQPDDTQLEEARNRMDAFAGTLKRKALVTQRGEREFHTPFGTGIKRLYGVTADGRSEQVALYVLAGPRDIVYLRSSGPSESFGQFERLTDAIVFGVQVLTTPASLP